MKAIFGLIAAASAVLLYTHTHAQSATTTGNSGTTCTQSGTTLVCTTTTTLTLPSGTNLNGMSLPQGSTSGPACSGLTVTPSTLDSGVATPLLFSVTGCPTSSTYSYAWDAPLPSLDQATNSYTDTLTANSSSHGFGVNVCFKTNPSLCTKYNTAITLKVPVTALAGCGVSPATSSAQVGTSPVLAAGCSAGTAAGSGVAYQWSRNGTAIAGAVGSTYTLSATADTATAGVVNNYSVQITNSAPSSATATASVTVTPAAVGSTDYCPSTPVRLTINASDSYRKIYTTDYTGTFSAGNDFVIQFEVGANDTTLGRFLATLGFVDYGATRGGRYVTFSQNKCDYTNGAQWVSPNFAGIKTAVNAGTASVSIGSTDSRAADVRLTPGRWYLNIQNVVGACPSNVSCHAAIEWAN